MGETGDNIAIQDFGLYFLILSHVFPGMRRHERHRLSPGQPPLELLAASYHCQNAESDPTAVHTPGRGAGDNPEFGKFQFPG